MNTLILMANSLLKRFRSWRQARRMAREQRKALYDLFEMNDHILRDIGLPRERLGHMIHESQRVRVYERSSEPASTGCAEQGTGCGCRTVQQPCRGGTC